MGLQTVTLKSNQAIKWFQKCLREAVCYGISAEEIGQLEIFITSTLDDVDIRKQINTVVIPTFYESISKEKLLKVNKTSLEAQAFIIRLFMKYYGGSCFQFKNTLDKFTSKILSNCFTDENIILRVTRYLALYPQLGGSGQQGVKHAEAWANQFIDYLYSANYFLNQLYSNLDIFSQNECEEYEGKFDISVFNLSELENCTPKERYEKLTSIFVFFNTAIQSMLLSMFSTTKRFNPEKVIELALSTLSVTSEKLNATNVTEDTIALDSVLWKLSCSVIKTVSALIKSCGRILIPQGTSICRILLQSLNSTLLNSSDSRYGVTRSKYEQRELTYQVLCSWQSVAGSQSSLEMFSESLTSGIIYDIKYDKPSLDLVFNEQMSNKKKKSAALNEKILKQRDTIVMHDYHANKNICNEAHTTLQLFLNTMSMYLKPLQFKIFQSTVMGLLLEVSKCQCASDYPLPYFDDSCRLNLYKSLQTLVTSPHPQCITQASVALCIFNLGLTDRDVKIKEVCRSSLSELEHIIRPRNDTLFFPLEDVVEVPQTAQNAIAENKTHVLQQIKGVLDTTEPSKLIQQETRIGSSNTKNTNPIVLETYAVKKPIIISGEPGSAIPIYLKPLEEVSDGSIKDLNIQVKDVPQETITNSQLDKPAVDLTEEKFQRSVATPLRNDTVQAKDIMVQPMDVDMDACPSDTKKKEDDEKVHEMLKDFIDSD